MAALLTHTQRSYWKTYLHLLWCESNFCAWGWLVKGWTCDSSSGQGKGWSCAFVHMRSDLACFQPQACQYPSDVCRLPPLLSFFFHPQRLLFFFFLLLPLFFVFLQFLLHLFLLLFLFLFQNGVTLVSKASKEHSRFQIIFFSDMC